MKKPFSKPFQHVVKCKSKALFKRPTDCFKPWKEKKTNMFAKKRHKIG